MASASPSARSYQDGSPCGGCRGVVFFPVGEDAPGCGGVAGGADDGSFLGAFHERVPVRPPLAAALPLARVGYPAVLLGPLALVGLGLALDVFSGLIELALVVVGGALAGGENLAGASPGDGGAVGDAVLAPVVVALDVDAFAGEPELEPLQEFLRAGAPQGFLAGAGDDAVVGALAQYRLGAQPNLLVERLRGFGGHDLRPVCVELAAFVDGDVAGHCGVSFWAFTCLAHSASAAS